MNTLHIYTDGACSGNPGPGGAAAVLITTANLVVKKVSQGYKESTNQRMELAAAILGLKAALSYAVDEFDGIFVHTDSAYVIGLMNKGYNAKANSDMVKELKDLTFRAASYGPVSFVKVAGHAGDTYNEMADKLAVAACSSPTAVEDKGYGKHPALQNDTTPEPSLFDDGPATITTQGGRRLVLDPFAYGGRNYALVLDQRLNPITVIQTY